ncbi:hypothetical protein CVT24_001697 [Panaeolus cyanescens]|uniref:Uncharacterized protein n=1 Tax=Panaeolus cyanescens TaxID=181874 RepID=A0A409YFM9_9AGAR|nr:hypothetical protein CVT24_001697 [Panaeolus cyanescens]
MSSRDIIDDTDPRVAYSAMWTRHGSDFAYGNSAHLTGSASATATLRFNGTSVEVYGTVQKASSTRAPLSSYTLEDGSSAMFKPNETSNDQHKVLFFRKEGLAKGEHVLVIRNLIPDDALWLDYFTVDGGSTASGTGVHSLPVGAIIAVALASLFITLAILLLGFFLWTRHHKRKRKSAPRHAYSPIYTRETNRRPVTIRPPNPPQRPQSSTRGSTPRPSRSGTPVTHPTITPYNLDNREPDPPAWGRPNWSLSHSATSLPLGPQHFKPTYSPNARQHGDRTRRSDSRNSRPSSSSAGPSSAPIPAHSQAESYSPQGFPPPYTTVVAQYSGP